MLRITLSALVAAGALVAVSSPALAAPARVTLGDLDLTRAAHVDVLDRRIDAAADSLCRSAGRTGGLRSDHAYCRQSVRAEVMNRLSATARTEYASTRRSHAL